MNSFKKELSDLINIYSKENDSNTPDFLLAKYLNGCLKNYNRVVIARDKWYDISPRPGWDCDKDDSLSAAE